MPNKILWDAAPSGSTVLSTELNSLASNTMSAAGTEYDNSTNLNQYGFLEVDINVFGVAPTANRTLEIFMVKAPDGTNYETSPTTTVQNAERVAIIPVLANTSAQKYTTPIFQLPPCKVKFLLWNNTDQALDAAGHTVKLYPFNDEVQ
jgi:hypothetical protein